MPRKKNKTRKVSRKLYLTNSPASVSICATEFMSWALQQYWCCKQMTFVTQHTSAVAAAAAWVMSLQKEALALKSRQAVTALCVNYGKEWSFKLNVAKVVVLWGLPTCWLHLGGYFALLRLFMSSRIVIHFNWIWLPSGVVEIGGYFDVVLFFLYVACDCCR